MTVITKQGIDISFAQGLDTKTDPKRVAMGNFLSLENVVFTKGGQLTKRNGYGALPAAPTNSAAYLTTLNGNLTAIGTSIAAYDASNQTWVNKGNITPMSVSTLPVLRNSLNQIACDSAVAPNGLVCTVYLENTFVSTSVYKYVIASSVTGQNIVNPTAVPIASGFIVSGARVFVLGSNFIILFNNAISGTSHLQYVAINIHTPSMVSANIDIAPNVTPFSSVSFDAQVVDFNNNNSSLFIAYNTTSPSQSVKLVSLSQALVVSAPLQVWSGYKATLMSMCIDEDSGYGQVIYISWFNSAAFTGYTAAVNNAGNLIMNPVQIISSSTVGNLASAAQHGTCTIFVEETAVYGFDTSIGSNYIYSVTVTPAIVLFTSVFSSGASSITVSSSSGLTTGMTLIDETTSTNIAAGTTITVTGTTLALSHNTAGNSASTPGDTLTAATVSSVTSPTVVIRGVGLASKAFIINGSIYFLSTYSFPTFITDIPIETGYAERGYQPTYFMINGSLSTSASPVVVAKLAYENGGGYLTNGLPGVTVTDSTVQIAYLFKDLVQAVNKNTNVPTGNQVAGIYSQTGVNLASFEFGFQGLQTSEIANVLHITGGFLWMYDGYYPVEHNFLLYPDIDQVNPGDMAVWHTTGGNLSSRPPGWVTGVASYYYQFTYEWTDNVGNTYRSAPSIPIAVTTSDSGSNLTTGSVTLNIPTLRLTYKTLASQNAVHIGIYRWSVGQQEYYSVTSVASPVFNDTTVDYITFTDTLSDASILGNELLYTTGGVVEDINAPASNIITLFDTRLWLTSAEDPNLLFFSKQVIEATPVEMSDLFTVFIPPTTASQGSTGPITALAPMDDKLIIFKQSEQGTAIYYINGSGPDNTGANNQYSNPIFVTSTIGCKNPRSIVFMPQGLMFETDKGTWLLDRSLSTSYIGAPVERFNSANIVAAQNIPATNQVRFLLDSGITEMYDYYYNQWGTFTGVPGVSATIYNGLHTYINSDGGVFQETPDLYLDGSLPVLMQFTTGPIRLDQLQSYQRAYFLYLLGTYYSPHKLYLSIYFDYAVNPSQTVLIQPDNFAPTYGSPGPYGQGNPYGGPNSLENWRIFFKNQRCQAVAIGLQEIYDPSLGVASGPGLTLSGLNFVLGFKNKFRPMPEANSAG